jgi:hypothetical protein
MANVVIIGATLPVVGLSVAASSKGGTTLFEYDNTAAGSWSTHALTSEFGGHAIIGSAHGVAGDGEFALAARIENGDLGLFVGNANATSSFQDVTKIADAPAAASDPNVFLDPFGNVDLIYVSTQDRLIMISPHAVSSPRVAHVTSHVTLASHALPPGGVGTRPPALFQVTDLTVASHVPMSPGLPSVSVSGMTAMVFDRSTKGDAVVLPLQWRQLNVTPAIGTASDVTAATGSPTLLNTPVSMPGVAHAFAATTTTGHVEYFAQAVAGSWSVTDVTDLSSSPPSTGELSIATNGPALYLASLSSSGHVQLFSSSSLSASPSSAAHVRALSTREYAHVTTLAPPWKYRDLTTVITGSPVWTGNIFLSATLTSINVAGRAADWGDLYDYTDTLPSLTWTSKDVSLSAGATTAATTGVTGVLNDGTLQLFAPGEGILVARGVGVYAIPSNDWVRAISDGWPIISETGGLGTLSPPWVGFTPAAPLNHSPDYLMGQSIVASKKRVTWLSFWTVSGPMTPADQTAASYYNHGFLAGQWVAQQIDQYHLSGLNLKPNWVILDPEGFPDNHSGLDAPAGASKATIAKHASYWTAMLNGWATGINDVDPSLHPGVYASMSEYHNYALATTPLPVFQAIAFGGGGPVRVTGSDGPNILGYIAFDGVCTPTASLHAQENTLLNPPWAGQFNTLQFNSGVYCAP